MTGKHLRKGALPRPVGPHDGVGLTSVHRKIDAVKYLFTFNPSVEVCNLEHVN
jgi:hypothetical protein